MCTTPGASTRTCNSLPIYVQQFTLLRAHTSTRTSGGSPSAGSTPSGQGGGKLGSRSTWWGTTETLSNTSTDEIQANTNEASCGYNYCQNKRVHQKTKHEVRNGKLGSSFTARRSAARPTSSARGRGRRAA
jgi:hypothetical protein